MASFSEAFNKARSAGKRQFTWEGKKYHTRKKGESDKEWNSHLGGDSTRPKARPSSVEDKGSLGKTRPKARQITDEGTSAPKNSKRPRKRPASVEAQAVADKAGRTAEGIRDRQGTSKPSNNPKTFRGVTWDQYTEMSPKERDAARLPAMITRDMFAKKAQEEGQTKTERAPRSKTGPGPAGQSVTERPREETESAPRRTASRMGRSMTGPGPGYNKGGVVKNEIGASRKPHQKGTPKFK